MRKQTNADFGIETQNVIFEIPLLIRDCVTMENGSRKLQLALRKRNNLYMFRSLKAAATIRMYDYDTTSKGGGLSLTSISCRISGTFHGGVLCI